MSFDHQKKIAVINDFCGFGRCSLTVSIPIISALKIQCCPLPTAVFSNHTAYDSFYCTDYTGHMEPYMAEWEKLGLEFDGILTGYLGSVAQVRIVKDFLNRFKKEDTRVVVDPVMGDGGHLYASYAPELAKKMKELLPYADVLTPNLTEACILTDTVYKEDMREEELEVLCEKLSKQGPEHIVISGLTDGSGLRNYVYERGKPPCSIAVRKIGVCRAGTGDVFSSVIAADVVNGADLVSAVKHGAEFISKVLEYTTELQVPVTDGICFEQYLSELGKGEWKYEK